MELLFCTVKYKHRIINESNSWFFFFYYLLKLSLLYLFYIPAFISILLFILVLLFLFVENNIWSLCSNIHIFKIIAGFFLVSKETCCFFFNFCDILLFTNRSFYKIDPKILATDQNWHLTIIVHLWKNFYKLFFWIKIRASLKKQKGYETILWSFFF